MDFRILRRLEVGDGEQLLPLGGTRQRALLAVLLLNRRQIVSLDRLTEQLWGFAPPPSAAKTVQVYVSRLRKVLDPAALETVGHGYRLAVSPEHVDLDTFDALVSDGRSALRAGDTGRAIDRLGAALALCPERPLEEFRYEPFAQAEIERLAEVRLHALEERIDAELQAGGGPELVGELERSVADHPERERLVAGLMLALYRAGRHSDALAAYRAARAGLMEGLGLEPGPELRDLEQRILTHDPSLGTVRRATAVARRSLRRPVRRMVVIAAAVILAIVTLTAMTLGARSHRPRSPSLLGGAGLVAIDAGSGAPAVAAPVSDAIGAIGRQSSQVWIADPAGGAVSRIDPRTGSVVDRVVVGGSPSGVVGGDGAVWTAGAVGSTVTRIDAGTGSITQRIRLHASSLGAMTFARGNLWVADPVDRTLFEIDPAQGTLRRTVSVAFQPGALTMAARALWVSGFDTSTVEKIDPASGRSLGVVHVGAGPSALTSADGSIWVADSLAGTVSRIDPNSLKVVATVGVGTDPSSLTAAGGSVWVGSDSSASVSRIDPRRDAVSSRVAVGAPATSLTAVAGRVWAAVSGDVGPHRGGTLSIAATTRFASIDPALFYQVFSPQFIGLSYDTLVTFDHSGTGTGLEVVPDLSRTLPEITDHGMTYTFRLRSGIRYSDGRSLRASDFRRGFERLFRVSSPGAPLFSLLRGAERCRQRPATCDLSAGVVADDTSDTVTFHLIAPDPDFLLKLTQEEFSAPIPAGTPDHAPLADPPVGTGPYRVLLVTRSDIRFGRNPYFREWSPDAQPAGNPNFIDWHFVASARAAVAAVQRGVADYFLGLVPAAQYHMLQLHEPAQLHSNPTFTVEFLPLNTHRPPFDDRRARQALNFAIDRGRIARLYGGPEFATPTCQPLTPGLPGYRRFCPYTRDPSADGAWRAPDLARARRLVRASGTKGQRVDLWGTSDSGYVPRGVSVYVAEVLRALGYRVHLHVVTYESITEARRRHFQISADGDWVPDYPAPSAYLPQFFGCGGGDSNGYYCDPGLDRSMQLATAETAGNRGQADRQWTAVDHRLTEAAAWVPTVNLRQVDLVSARLHNFQYNPVWGFLVDQSWLGH